jgi:hypothetical protein
VWTEAEYGRQRDGVFAAEIVLPVETDNRQGEHKKEYLLEFHRDQIHAEESDHRGEEQWKNRRIHARADWRGWSKEISGLGIRLAVHNVLRVVYVHGEIVGPDVTWANCGGVESGNRKEQEN